MATATATKKQAKQKKQKKQQSTQSTQSTGYSLYWQNVGGERYYTLARWVMLVLIFAIVLPLSTSPIWPISLTGDPLVLVLWSYVALTLLFSFALFIPSTAKVIKQSYIVDVLFIVLLSILSTQPALFLPFYILPLISVSVQQKPMMTLIAGGIVAIAYGAGTFFTDGGAIELSAMLIMAQALLIAFIPWLSSSLVGQWSANNGRQIAEAEQQKNLALQETQAYRAQMNALALVGYELSKTMDHGKLLNKALEEVQKLAPYNVAIALFSTGRPKELKVDAVWPSNPAYIGRTLDVGDGTVGTMLRAESEACVIANVGQDPELTSLPVLQNCNAGCIVPLRLQATTFGLLLIASEQPSVYNEHHLVILKGVASYVIAALYNAQMQTDLKQANGKLRAKEKQVRDQIASKIHDGPTQTVAQFKMQVEFVKQVAKNDPSMLADELDKLRERAELANADMRQTLYELRPLTLETEGLRAGLEEYVKKLKLRSGTTQIAVKTRGQVDTAVDNDTAGVLFDIVQESVNNALKHAEAQNIWIRLERKDDLFRVTIEDNGKGFDVGEAKAAAAKRASFGLHNFGERAQMANASVEIDSKPGEGSKVSVVVPIEQ